MLPHQNFCLELRLVGEVKMMDPTDNDELAAGHVTIDLGKVAQMLCSSEEFYMEAPKSPIKFAKFDDALVLGIRRTGKIARDMHEGRLSGEKLAEAVAGGKFRSFGLRGNVTPEIMKKLDDLGLRAVAPLIANNKVN